MLQFYFNTGLKATEDAHLKKSYLNNTRLDIAGQEAEIIEIVSMHRETEFKSNRIFNMLHCQQLKTADYALLLSNGEKRDGEE
ncbi:hypothetical protein T11_31 [Trichinella zimbabwensis]|uniref:Uncharacterized protein n=1 Tax=Trichinella zimbabwensis TaxID=268475 RepID=A0A0V1HS03_9BILA|nr:hypothetical protein T11_31 [Trichinella zimbabwensis]